jgi:hypothetical protein
MVEEYSKLDQFVVDILFFKVVASLYLTRGRDVIFRLFRLVLLQLLRTAGLLLLRLANVNIGS